MLPTTGAECYTDLCLTHLSASIPIWSFQSSSIAPSALLEHSQQTRRFHNQLGAWRLHTLGIRQPHRRHLDDGLSEGKSWFGNEILAMVRRAGLGVERPCTVYLPVLRTNVLVQDDPCLAGFLFHPKQLPLHILDLLQVA